MVIVVEGESEGGGVEGGVASHVTGGAQGVVPPNEYACEKSEGGEGRRRGEREGGGRRRRRRREGEVGDSFDQRRGEARSVHGDA